MKTYEYNPVLKNEKRDPVFGNIPFYGADIEAHNIMSEYSEHNDFYLLATPEESRKIFSLMREAKEFKFDEVHKECKEFLLFQYWSIAEHYAHLLSGYVDVNRKLGNTYLSAVKFLAKAIDNYEYDDQNEYTFDPGDFLDKNVKTGLYEYYFRNDDWGRDDISIPEWANELILESSSLPEL